MLRDLHTETESAFFPVSLLNAIRREGLEKLTQERILNHPVESSEPGCYPLPEKWFSHPRLLVSTPHFSDLQPLLDNGADAVIFAPTDYTKASLLPHLEHFPERAYLQLPVQCNDRTLHFLHSITQEKQIPVVLSSPGQMGLKWKEALCGEGIPVMNSETVKLLSHLGYLGCTLSRELRGDLAKSMPLHQTECILPVYGRTRLMVLNHCPMRTQKGMKQNRHLCTLCKEGRGAAGTFMTDRMGASYPLLPVHLPETCLVQLHAAVPLNLSDKANSHRACSWLIAFTTETESERLQVLRHFAALRKGEHPLPLPQKGTLGRYPDGVL